MSRHTSDSIKIITQAQLICGAKDLNRQDNHSEQLVAVVDKYACVLVANDKLCKVCSLPKLEDSYKGGDEQELEESTVLCEKAFPESIARLSLSADCEFVAIHTLNKVEIYHISSINTQVVPRLCLVNSFAVLTS
jgi:hypothetical protein